MEYIYRFRSVDALLGEHAELGKQEIFFASTKQLNDPVEGYKDLFWKADVIAWKNFLRHYVLCLMQTILRALENENGYVVTPENLPIRMIPDELHPETGQGTFPNRPVSKHALAIMRSLRNEFANGVLTSLIRADMGSSTALRERAGG